MVQDDKHNILFFCVKMFKAIGDSFYLEILCPDWDIYQHFLYMKKIFLKELFLEEVRFNAKHLTLTFRTVKNLCPNFQKPLLPPKIPGYVPDYSRG